MSLRIRGVVLAIDAKPWTMFEGTPQEKSGVSYTALVGEGVDIDQVKLSEDQAGQLAGFVDTGEAVELTVIPQLSESPYNLLAPYKLKLRMASLVAPVEVVAAAPFMSAVGD